MVHQVLAQNLQYLSFDEETKKLTIIWDTTREVKGLELTVTEFSTIPNEKYVPPIVDPV